MALTKIDISMMQNTGITASKLLVYDGSGNIPAVDGSQITGVATGVTASASDPVITTNPSGGVGSEWHNTTSGEAYICTDATAGENIWTNVGAGSGGVAPFHFTRCTTSYFCASGYWRPNNPGPYYDVASIDKNSFASDGNSTDQGDLTSIRDSLAGAASTTHGYCMGGYHSGYQNWIEKFGMSAPANTTDVGDLSTNQGSAGGCTSETHGWVQGGVAVTTPLQKVEKVSFATDGGGTNVGDLLPNGRDYAKGACSSSHGYSMGGVAAGTNSEYIHKWSFSSETATHHIGDLVHSGIPSATCSSDGYTWCMGTMVAPSITRIDKMSTASDSSTVASGSTLLTVTSQNAMGNASSTHGYIMGGFPKGDSAQGQYYRDTIEKFAFASDNTATDVGNLTHNRGEPGNGSIQL